MKVYLIPGLAADKRVFRHIRLPEGYDPVCMEWEKPSEHDDLPAYARRMAAQINMEEPFVLAGLSFGGMLAIEIAKWLKPEKTILIASIPDHRHLPSYYRLAWRLGLQRIITPGVIKNGVFIKRLLTAESPEDKAIIREMARDMDAAFVKWAMKAIMHWEAAGEHPNYIHIHGTADLILPYRFTKPSHSIPKGGHLMIFNKAEEINQILETVLMQRVQ